MARSMWLSEENLAGGDDARAVLGFAQDQRAGFVDAFEHARGLPVLRAARGCAYPIPPARASHASRTGRETPRTPDVIPFREAGGETCQAPRAADGAFAPNAASEVAGNSVSVGKCARLMPMPMASQSGRRYRCSPIPEECPRSFVRQQARHSAISPDVGIRRESRNGVMRGKRRDERQLRAFAGRFAGAQKKRRGKIAGGGFPGAAAAAPAGGLTFGGDPDGPGSPAAARRRASSFVESMTSNAASVHSLRATQDVTAPGPAPPRPAASSIGAAPTTNNSVKALERVRIVPRLEPIVAIEGRRGFVEIHDLDDAQIVVGADHACENADHGRHIKVRLDGGHEHVEFREEARRAAECRQDSA